MDRTSQPSSQVVSQVSSTGSSIAWLTPGRPRLALGCMRLSTDGERDDARAQATIEAALDAGIGVLDTARAYGQDDGDLGHNERVIAAVVRASPVIAIVTKGGMRRPEGRWQPDGRAGALRADAEASVEALGRVPDVWLLHAPDPRTKLSTSLRALAAIHADGLARHVGVSNVQRAQLEEAVDAAPIAAVEVALGAFDDAPLRGGVVELCTARGIPLLAHAPLGGPGRAAKLARDPVLAEMAAEREVTVAQLVLAWLMDLSPVIVPVVGARTPERAREMAAAASIALDDEARERLAARFPASAMARPRAQRPSAPAAATDGEVVLVMGIPGAGKTRATGDFVGRGYHRLNRDERGGDLRKLAGELDSAIAGGARRLVLDNTYVTRASRADAIEAAWRYGLPVRGLWLDTPPAQAQVNLCARLVEQLGALPGPEALRASRKPGVMAPTQHMRTVRLVEPPAMDEGFASLEVVPFARAMAPDRLPGRVVALDVMERVVRHPQDRPPDPVSDREAALQEELPTLILGWRPEATDAELEALRDVTAARGHALALCTHPGGPPICWCRPPLPGLVVAWALASGIDLARLTVVGSSTAFRTLASALGARWSPVPLLGS